jgi:hypothetical protein
MCLFFARCLPPLDPYQVTANHKKLLPRLGLNPIDPNIAAGNLSVPGLRSSVASS